MNKTNVIEYIKFAHWAIKSKQFDELLKLSPDDMTNRINQIIKEENQEVYKDVKGLLPNEHIMQNMEAYNTTAEEANMYESHCHNCGSDICIGDKYCGKGCFKFVEEFNYDCHWGKSCKMCHVHQEYVIMTREFEFKGQKYWIDNENTVWNK